MKKIMAFIFVLMLFANAAKAQYVNIPDSNFRSFLKIKYPNCFNSAGMMDTTCNTITNVTQIVINGLGIKKIDGIQFFKNLANLNCKNNLIDSINFLPNALVELECSNNRIKKIKLLPQNLRFLICKNNLLDSLPLFGDSIWRLDYSNNNVRKINILPNQLNYLDCSYNLMDSLPNLPNKIRTLFCWNNNLAKLPQLSDSLIDLRLDSNKLSSLPSLPNNLQFLYCNYNKIVSLPQLPYKVESLEANFNMITSLPTLPSGLKYLKCDNNFLIQLPQLPDSLVFLSCSNNQLTALPTLNSKLTILQCPYNFIITLPSLPASISSLNIGNNKLTQLSPLPKKIKSLSVNNNQLTSISSLGDSLRNLYLGGNLSLSCLPFLPATLKLLSVQNTNIKCFPNMPSNLNINSFFPNFPICNNTNNPNHCQSFPQILSNIFIDNNLNGIKDSNEVYKKNVKVQLSNNSYTFTNSNGKFQIAADGLGAYTLAIIPPPFYTAVPSTINFNFSNYDTLVNLPDIALQPNTLKDSLSITATPINFAARPGFKYAYNIQYENVGTTILSPTINFSYDNNLLTYDSSSNSSVVNSSNSLSLYQSIFKPGQTGNFVVYFKVKTTAALGTNLLAVASVNAGNCSSIDSVATIVRGSYDPNDKYATPTLTLQDVTNRKYINYTIRFQNTGTDTAFNVIISDSLSGYLKTNNLKGIASSHPCKFTLKNGVAYFEFFGINLPDSNTNKLACNGFVKFQILADESVAAGTVIPNKAYIFFDYNKAIITNIATTIIQNPLPLTLVNFGALPKPSGDISVYWATANEINTKYFIIETSVDGSSFKPTAELAAIGVGDNSYSYSIASATVLYIRLKVVDKDGKVAYSKIVKISEIKNSGITIYPNPAKKHLYITANKIDFSNTSSKLINSMGMVVKSFTLKSGLQSIDISDLAMGVYYLQTGLQTIKVFVEK